MKYVKGFMESYYLVGSTAVLAKALCVFSNIYSSLVLWPLSCSLSSPISYTNTFIWSAVTGAASDPLPPLLSVISIIAYSITFSTGKSLNPGRIYPSLVCSPSKFSNIHSLNDS